MFSLFFSQEQRSTNTYPSMPAPSCLIRHSGIQFRRILYLVPNSLTVIAIPPQKGTAARKCHSNEISTSIAQKPLALRLLRCLFFLLGHNLSLLLQLLSSAGKRIPVCPFATLKIGASYPQRGRWTLQHASKTGTASEERVLLPLPCLYHCHCWTDIGHSAN